MRPSVYTPTLLGEHYHQAHSTDGGAKGRRGAPSLSRVRGLRPGRCTGPLHASLASLGPHPLSPHTSLLPTFQAIPGHQRTAEPEGCPQFTDEETEALGGEMG